MLDFCVPNAKLGAWVIYLRTSADEEKYVRVSVGVGERCASWDTRLDLGSAISGITNLEARTC